MLIQFIKEKLKSNRNFIIAIIGLVSVRWSIADHYRVPSGSMKPTIQIGDHILVNKMAFDFKLPFTDIVLAHNHDPKRGDIVVFKSPKDPSINLIKRLIAIPGDQVEITNGVVKINGQETLIHDKRPIKLITENQQYGRLETLWFEEKIDQKIITVQRLPMLFRPEHRQFNIPAGKYLFMGDNRDNSADGRFFGLVDQQALKGKALNVTISVAFKDYLPVVNWGRFGKKLI